MTVLDVPGARLYYESHGGGGPLLLMVPGASGNGDIFRPVSQHLAEYYTVVSYDRRGFSRSQLNGPQDYDHRLEADADDVRRLIEHLSYEPAIVFGTSSGAIIALEVLDRHPSVVHTLVSHEPPAVRLLADGHKWIDFFQEAYDLYIQSGVGLALNMFRDQAFAELDRQAMARAPKNEYTLANAIYWFEHELRQYPAVELDLDALKAHADRIVPTAGRESRGYPCYGVSAELAKRFGQDLIELPGGHVGLLTQPSEFASALLRAIASTQKELRTSDHSESLQG